MRRMSFRQIETLRAIDDAGSLVQAAAALNMTPAALTARVKGLEESVGLRLFDRTPAGMRLTKAGESALGASRMVEQAMRNFADTLAAIRTGDGGLLSVGAVSTAKYFAPKLIAAFVALRPKLDLRFLIGNRDATIESLRASEVEIALCGRPPRDMAVDSTPLGPHPYVLVAAPDHRLAGLYGLSHADLAGETFLIREAGSGTRSLFEGFIGETGGRPVKLGMELGSNESIKQAVMAGLGIALLSAHTIGAEIESGRLVRLDVVGLPIIRHWYVIFRTDRSLSPTARAFRNFAEREGGRFLPQLGNDTATEGGGRPVAAPAHRQGLSGVLDAETG